MKNTTFVYLLSELEQQRIVALAKSEGFQDEEIELMINSRVCDLEDSININF